MAKTTKLTKIMNAAGNNYPDPVMKKKFHTEGKKVLRELAKELALKEYDVRSCEGGIAVLGEVTLHTPGLYLQVHGDYGGLPRIMYRTCTGMKDYTGGMNNWGKLTLLEEPERLKTFIQVQSY